MQLWDRLGWRLSQTFLCVLLPHFHHQNEYSGGISTIYVCRWGRWTRERWQWPSYRDEEVRDRCAAHGMSRRNIYRLIQAEAQLLERKPSTRRAATS